MKCWVGQPKCKVTTIRSNSGPSNRGCIRAVSHQAYIILALRNLCWFWTILHWLYVTHKYPKTNICNNWQCTQHIFQLTIRTHISLRLMQNVLSLVQKCSGKMPHTGEMYVIKRPLWDALLPLTATETLMHCNPHLRMILVSMLEATIDTQSVSCF